MSPVDENQISNDFDPAYTIYFGCAESVAEINGFGYHFGAPAPVPARAPVAFAPLAAPVLPAAVPMDVDRAQTRTFPRTCFRCGAAGHLARECPVTSDVRHTAVLDEVVRQLGDDLLDELFARLSTSASHPAESVDGGETDPAGFPHSAEPLPFWDEHRHTDLGADRQPKSLPQCRGELKMTSRHSIPSLGERIAAKATRRGLGKRDSR
ncbi:hypothetical protein B0H14DRAFT_3505998 [Mycena olivaceomarginata]|nr:hypothetical protein B0H14DRAFT_3505998 [Mycena olivaceomarginata]